MWRMDKYLRRLDVSDTWHRSRLLSSARSPLLTPPCTLSFFFFFFCAPAPAQAALVVADKTQSLQITGNGDVLEPHDGIIAIGSGSPYALAAARALIDVPGMDALAIAKKAMKIAADACICTNENFTALQINAAGEISEPTLK
jgi:hypothetical protein